MRDNFFVPQLDYMFAVAFNVAESSNAWNLENFPFSTTLICIVSEVRPPAVIFACRKTVFPDSYICIGSILKSDQRLDFA